MRILTWDCHESLICAWAMLGHEIHLLPYIAEWKWNIQKRPIPDNVKLLPIGFDMKSKDYDVCVAFNEHTQLPMARMFGIPYMCSFASLAKIRDQRSLHGERLIFCSYSQKKTLGLQGEVVYYPADLDEFNGYRGDNGRILSTINYFGQACNKNVKGFDWAYKITKGFGYDNWGWSLDSDTSQFPRPESFANLKELYRAYAIYLDPCTASPMSMSNIEAMATGMPLVTRKHDDWPLIIENGINGVCSDNDNEIREWMESIIKHKDLRERIGARSRETACEMFSVAAWKKNINLILEDVCSKKR